MTCPRNVNSCKQNLFFFKLMVSPAVSNLSRTIWRSWKCWVIEGEYTMMSSIYTKHIFLLSSPRTVSMSLWKVAGAFLSPNGMTLKWYRPAGVIKAVLFLLSGSMVTCQYPLLRTMVLKMAAPDRDSKISVIFGRG